jgi:hypothetical protein
MNSRNSNYSRLAALAATVLTVAACSNNDGGNEPPPPAANTAPAISTIANLAADQDTVITVPFDIADRESDASQLKLTAAVDGAGLIPADQLALGGSAGSRTVSLQPLEAATGMATVTLTVADPQGASTSRSFSVTVREKRASIRGTALDTFAKVESGDATPVNGLTFEQDADDAALFEPLIGPDTGTGE